MKERYIKLMAKALGAYTDGHIAEYFERVRREGLTEHGFPRLTANIGILICHGYREYLFPLFLQMMDFCCESIPRVKAANDFSVKEIVGCIMALEEKGLVDAERIGYWKDLLGTIVPENCYDKLALSPEDDINNWAIFTMQSEWMRQYIGLCDARELVDVQIASQLKHIDENGMYRDPHEPMVYDLVPRLLFSELLHYGYDGKYRDLLDSYLKNMGLLSLRMQSESGEIPFGGRSNQCLFNEGLLVTVFEFEANRYAKEGNFALAAEFKSAISLALDNTEKWLSEQTVRHIKNRFPLDTKYGCEKYAYFDKYMITTASYLYCAYSICDDSIPDSNNYSRPSDSFTLSEHFHKLFLRAGGYFLEFETKADPRYDSGGLGRVHKKGAPSPICLCVPCTDTPRYKVCTEEKYRASLCPGKIEGGKAVFACDSDEEIEVLSHSHENSSASASLRYPNGITAYYIVNADGVEIKARGDGQVLHMLPAFAFDGENETEISLRGNTLEIGYEGWICRYIASGSIKEMGKVARNRNGYYKLYYAEGDGEITVKIEIIKKD